MLSDADNQSLLLLSVDATRAKEIIEYTATLPALKLIKRGMFEVAEEGVGGIGGVER